MEEKSPKAATEVQLGFAFFTDTTSSALSLPCDDVAVSSPEVARESHGRHRRTRTGTAPPSFADVLATAQTSLLEASLEEMNAHLLSIFEFCEAALTRALDVVPTRQGLPFSAEEYRSLRGIGQAQWLLAEEQSRHEAKPSTLRMKKPKKVKDDT